ncbi:MAG: hypothetical protein NTZ49_00330 [Candidatus Parcubacteria bacterium]|nr:hypothetical protein [Candidatus Parcubacteria bacterium]
MKIEPKEHFMAIGMSMGPGLSLRQSVSQQLRVSLPPTNWSLLQAFEEDGKRGFNYPLTIKRRRIDGFDELDHQAKMKLIDEHNQVFRFVYTRGKNKNGKSSYYFKIPLMRDFRVDIDKIKIRISKAEYERALAILDNVGQMERIARAIPYSTLLRQIKKHLKKEHAVSLKQTVIVGIDRGGRLPAIILGRALNHSKVFFLKVDQGGRGLDVDQLNHFVHEATFYKKHVLFVDSTVDSGRQIRALRGYFDQQEWQQKLGFKSWSIVGSNENGFNHENHLNINWGVNPDQTFEDNPQLMGVDYAPGSCTKVVEVPSETSEKIRKLLLDVPDGYIFDFSDIDEQICVIKKKNADLEKEEQLCQQAEEEYQKIIYSAKWQKRPFIGLTVSFADLPESIPIGAKHNGFNILISGNGRDIDIPQKVADLVADTLGPQHSFFAGTREGNPGMILRTILNRIAVPEVRLYQPGYKKDRIDASFGGVPVIFAGEDKEDMRTQMVRDSQLVFAFGGGEGTLKEILLALKLGKPVVLIKGWGGIPAYFLEQKDREKYYSLKICDSVTEAILAILEITKA